MKIELSLSDGMSNNSDFSNDSHNSHFSTSAPASNAATDFAATDFGAVAPGSLILTPSTISFISLEGLHSGVPTRTTPTLTPTTLRSIEQTFIELQSKPHENEAGFVPPMVQSIGNNQYIPASEADIYTTVTSSGKSNTIWNSSISQCSSEDSNTSPSPADLQKNMQSPPPAPTRRNMGGRRPNREMNLPPEEEERRRVRRERNKAAAARCRKRRVDHTNQLLDETEELEKKKLALEKELSELQKCSEELEMLLENHRPCCKLQLNMHCPPSPPEEKPHAMHYETTGMQRVKTEMIETFQDDEYYVTPAKKIMLSSAVPISKPSRPNFLNVGGASPFGMTTAATNNNKSVVGPFDDALAGIGITTPSTGMHFNFDSLMVGGTGLTPVSAPLVPNCSAQQRIPVSMSGDVVSPETCVPPKLVSL